MCINNGKCPASYNKLIHDKFQCIEKCEKDNTFKYEYNNACYDDCPIRTIKISTNNYMCLGGININNYKNEIIDESIFDDIKKYLLNNYKLTKTGYDMETKAKNVLVTISNTINQKKI